LTQVAACFALKHVAVLQQQAVLLMAERDRLMNALSALSALKGGQAFPSSANFILFRLPNAVRVFSDLKQRGILIKCLDGGHPLLHDCLRVTVGTTQENDAFLAALLESLSAELN
jgi:histidinol-phosphate aminotransferase